MSKINFKDIHIGSLIHQKVIEDGISIQEISDFLECNEDEIEVMYNSKSLNTLILMQWSKLLKYDFFRIYMQHLVLYQPSLPLKKSFSSNSYNGELFQVRKYIYTNGVILYILELIKTGKKTRKQITDEYNIPKSTLYKWIMKYGN